MDKATELRNMLSFARVCVEVDLNASLPSSIHVDIEDFGGIELKAECPWKPKYCSICKELGHGNQFSPNSKDVWKPVQSKIAQESAQTIVEKAPPAGTTPVASEQVPIEKNTTAPSDHPGANIEKSNGSEKVPGTATDDDFYSDIAVEVPTSMKTHSTENKTQMDPTGTSRASCKNSFSVLNEISDEDGKKNIPLERVRKPTSKVAENLNSGIVGLSKGGEIGSKTSQKKKK